MTYAMSDIHGHYKFFLLMLEKINFSMGDNLYIIGDVIDRGPYPVACLLDVMRRPNVTLILGNHESMMLDSYLRHKGDSLWALNGSEVTLDGMDCFSDDQQEKMIGYLKACPIVIPDVCVDDRHFYLIHSAPLLRPVKKPVLFAKASEADIRQAVWSRDFRAPGEAERKKYAPILKRYKDARFLIGHTVVQRTSYGITDEAHHGRISPVFDGRVLNLDCGCGSGMSLGCLCLDTMEEFYVDAEDVS